MQREVEYSSGVIVRYENLPVMGSIEYLNTFITLSAIPQNFVFVEDPNPPITVAVRKESAPISLAI